MTYSIHNDLLIGDNVTNIGTKKKGGKMTPRFLVLHYTAGDNYEGDVRTLSTSDRPASCHLVLAADGRLTQIGDFKDVLWHAGKSAWKGFVGLNSHSIGIEVTCPGPVDGDQARYAGLEDGKPYHFTMAAHRNGGPVRKWAVFTEKQIEVLLELGGFLIAHYGLKEAVGHDQIAPTRKIDPGPSCPQSVFEILNGNKDEDDDVELPEITARERVKVKGVAPDTLTLRISPNGDKRGDLPENQIVEKLAVKGNWTQVRTPAGHVGFVYSDYLVAI